MFQIGLVVIAKQNLLRISKTKAYVGTHFRHTCYDWFGGVALQRVNQADDSQLAKQKIACMVGQIILGILGVLIGGGGLIAFVVGLVKPPKVSPEELAEFEEKKRKEKKHYGRLWSNFKYWYWW